MMELITWIESKTNEDVFVVVKEKRTSSFVSGEKKSENSWICPRIYRQSA